MLKLFSITLVVLLVNVFDEVAGDSAPSPLGFGAGVITPIITTLRELAKLLNCAPEGSSDKELALPVIDPATCISVILSLGTVEGMYGVTLEDYCSRLASCINLYGQLAN